jgi:hypothetical protein
MIIGVEEFLSNVNRSSVNIFITTGNSSVAATVGSLIQRRPTECGVSECDREVSVMRRSWPTRGCRTMGGRE